MKKNPLKPDDMWKGASAEIFANAKDLRTKSTKAEEALWEALKGNQLQGYKFRRQHPLNRYIADFYCHKLKLVIEIDGEYHQTQEQKELDKERTTTIEFQGLNVIRFTNDEVINNISDVISNIKTYIKKQTE